MTDKITLKQIPMIEHLFLDFSIRWGGGDGKLSLQPLKILNHKK